MHIYCRDINYIYILCYVKQVYYKYVRHVACLKRAAAVSLQKASGAWNGHLTALSQRAET